MDARPLDRRGLLRAGALGAVGALAGRPGARPQLAPSGPHFAPRARRLVYLYQSGGPAQHELLDPKPELERRHGEELPDSVRQGQRLTAMSGNQASLPLAKSVFGFSRWGESGLEFSELLPHTARHADRLCVVRSMWTDAINHDPAITFSQTGSEIAGRPSLGAWLSYALGSENADLPPYVVLVTKDKGGQPLYARLWGAGFLPTRHQGVQLRAGRDPVLYLQNPPGVSARTRRRMLDTLLALEAHQHEREGDPRIAAAMDNEQLAHRLQSSIPEVADFSSEPESTFELYGEDARRPGSFAANCLLARRLLERGVRCVQLFHQGWDQHGGLPGGLRNQCRETDQASAALVTDLVQRGLLEDTLVVWGGEFGRTAYCQGKLAGGNYGRDHHPRCFSVWMAGGGVRGGSVYGRTDEFGYNIVENPVHVHDLNATLLHCFGLDHEQLTYPYQGRRFRLTDVHGHVVRELLA